VACGLNHTAKPPKKGTKTKIKKRKKKSSNETKKLNEGSAKAAAFFCQ
jgi:hypothetical protein